MSPTGQSLASAREHIRALLEESRADLAGVRRRRDEILAVLDQSPGAVAAGPDESDADTRWREGLTDMERSRRKAATQVDALLAKFETAAETIVGMEAPVNGHIYGDYASYGDFLASVKSDWPSIPANENEALALALGHYKQAYVQGIESGNARIQTAYMIGELARRVGRCAEAREYLNCAVQLGEEWIKRSGDDRTGTALARHIVELAARQSRALDSADAPAMHV